MQILKLFGSRQDAAETFLCTVDNCQPISGGAGSGLHWWGGRQWWQEERVAVLQNTPL